jgi:uncharacterized repeat protein (TIGR03806 family)
VYLRLSFGLTLLAGCSDRRDRDVEPYDLDFDIPRTEDFAPVLSDYALYDGPLADRVPSDGTREVALSSELFTDYAKKQRLVQVPSGTSIEFTADSWVFAEGTVLAKTFFYPLDMRDVTGPERVIETRLLVKTEGVWNAATYLWNDAQTEAELLLDGTTTPVTWIDADGTSQSTDYAVPHEGECFTCHQSDGEATFIGPSPRNLNRLVDHDGQSVNQLALLHDDGVLPSRDWATVPTLPDTTNPEVPLEDRARAYLDINCAHCHAPGRWDEATQRDIDFRYETPTAQTGLDRQADELEDLLWDGEMPFIGTTVPHTEGIELVLDYIELL